jgi:glycosyltransferase involved in cell wall biosynthesis
VKNIGIYNLNMPTRGGGEKLTVVLAEHLSRNHNVQLFHDVPLERKLLEDTFGVDLSRVKFTQLDRIGPPLRVLARLRGRRTPFSTHHYLQLKKLKLDLFINVSHRSVLHCPAKKGIFVCMFPYDVDQDHRGEGTVRRGLSSLSGSIEQSLTGVDRTSWLDSYGDIVAISKYSADWVERLWARKAQVVYPPVDNMGPPSEKENMILHVGRFSSSKAELEHHDKAQEFLLAAFSDMKQLHQEGWELQFAGNVGSSADAKQLAESLAEKAAGLAVKFHFNVTFQELRELYRRAAIYWHATGIGTDPNIYPARHEHFGITTVEAMSAGGVPVVINSGGQTETVTEAVDGFRWEDVAELVQRTQQLATDSALRDRLSRAAIESSRRFSREAFTDGMDRIIGQALETISA